MRVTVRNGDAEVTIETNVIYSPDVADDMVTRATVLYRAVFDDEPSDVHVDEE